MKLNPLGQKCLILFIFILCVAVDAKRRKKKHKNNLKRGSGHHNITQFLQVMAFFIAVIVVPLLCNFIYKIYKDPATPRIVGYYWDNFKKNGFGYLGQEKSKKSRRSRRNKEALD
jgi:hypothetical protein